MAASVGKRLVATASALAELDVLAGLAELARSTKLLCPQMTEDTILNIKEGRHPVLDITEADGLCPQQLAMWDWF